MLLMQMLKFLLKNYIFKSWCICLVDPLRLAFLSEVVHINETEYFASLVKSILTDQIAGTLWYINSSD